VPLVRAERLPEDVVHPNMVGVGVYMSLQEFAWLGATMIGVGVLASIIYVSIQIRNNTRVVRASAFQQVINSFAGISFDIAKDKKLVDLYLRAGKDFGSLGALERAQHSLMLLSFLRRAENVFSKLKFTCFTLSTGPVSAIALRRSWSRQAHGLAGVKSRID
jgi:hypothetical protein